MASQKRERLCFQWVERRSCPRSGCANSSVLCVGENSGSSETHVAGSVFSQRDGPVHFRSVLWGYTRCLEVDGTRVPASPRDPPAPAGGSLGAAARVKWQLLAQAQEPPEGPEGVAWGQPLCPPCWPRHGWTARSLSRGHSPGTRASSRAAGLCAGPSAAAVAEPSPRSRVRVPERAHSHPPEHPQGLGPRLPPQ